MSGPPTKKRAAAAVRKAASRPTPPAPRSTNHEPRTTAFPPTAHVPRPTPLSGLRYDAAGLVAAVVQDADTGAVLMLGYMDREALGATLATGEVHFHSRSRGVLWRKGETSGNVLRLVSIAADCDGDALLVRAHPAGPTCHTGETNCFHSEIASSSAVPAAPRTPRNDAKDEESAASSVLPPAPRTSPNDVEPVQSAEPMWGRRSAPAYSDRRDPTNARGERAPHPRSPLPESPPEARRSDAHDELGGNESVLPGELQAEGLTLAPLFAVLRDRAERRPDGSYTVKLLDNEDKALKKLIEEAGEVALAVKNRDRANLVWELADVLYHLAVIMVAQGVAPADVNAELARRAGERR